jgi:hypothetical protein
MATLPLSAKTNALLKTPARAVANGSATKAKADDSSSAPLSHEIRVATTRAGAPLSRFAICELSGITTSPDRAERCSPD